MTDVEASVAEGLKSAMRRLAQTVCVVSLRDRGGARLAITASSPTSVSLSPPSMLVCVNREASPHDHLLETGSAFCISVLAEDMQEVASLCAGQAQGEARFAAGNWQQQADTACPFVADALANIFCQTDATLSYGTHLICVGRVTAVQLRGEPGRPLLYADGGYTSLTR